MAAVSLVLHPAIEEALPGPRALADQRLPARARIALLLEAAGLLSLLARAGWRLTLPLREAGISPAGHLRIARAGLAPGRDNALPQETLAELLSVLFPSIRHERCAGRGEAMRVARELAGAWRQRLVPIRPDVAVAHILDAAPFLWRPDHAGSRRSLAGEVVAADGRREAWIAGPGLFRRRIGLGARSLPEIEATLASPAAEQTWLGDDSAPMRLATACQWRAAVAAFRREPPQNAAGAMALGEALYALGRFTDALAAIRRVGTSEARCLKLQCQVQLGELRAASLTLRSLVSSQAAPLAVLDASDSAVRLLSNRGRQDRALRWAQRGIAIAKRTGVPGLLARAHVIAALAAWDRKDHRAQDRHLGLAEEGLAVDPLARWRWHQAKGLRAMAAGDGAAVTKEIALALTTARRTLRRHEAAGLWNDLGVGRTQAGDLAGAERAFSHAARLFAECDGPRAITLALHNLAEVRLRRGSPAGVQDLLLRTAAANQRSGNVRAAVQDAELMARYELLLGRPEEALRLCERFMTEAPGGQVRWRAEQLAVLAARALGWLGRAEDASAILQSLGELPADDGLDPEERPAVWALAGEHARAVQAAITLGEGLAALWQEFLAGALSTGEGEGKGEVWAALLTLPTHRMARLAYDFELLLPGTVPNGIRRRAAATLRQLGATGPSALLATSDQEVWRLLGECLALPERQVADWQSVFAAAGHPEAELLWTPGVGSGSQVRLRARRVDPRLATLFAVAARDLGGRPGSEQPDRAMTSSPAPLLARIAEAASELRDAPTTALRLPLHPAGENRAVMIGESLPFEAAMARLGRFAAADFPVLIRGESGTGKELAARLLHRLSARAGHPFVAINCGALSETLLLSDLFGHVKGAFTGADRDRPGVFESAQGGVVLLDEIGDLPPAAQASLLRVLQEGEVRRLGESISRRVNVRVIAATHRDLEQLVGSQLFRGDLYFRLQVGIVVLPPLRERHEDLDLLIDHFLVRLAAPSGRRPTLSPAARVRLHAHSWPGNVRELQNRLRLAAALADEQIDVGHFDLPSEAGREVASYHEQIASFRHALIERTLLACAGSQAAAARRLGLSRQALSYLVRQLGPADGVRPAR